MGTSRLDEAIYVNKLLPVVCKLLNVADDGVTVQHVRQLASHVLFVLSVNNFSTLFKSCFTRFKTECLIASGDETCEAGDLDLIQHMKVDMSKLTRLLNEEVQKWRLLKKIHHIELVKSVEKAIWNWLDTYPEEFTDLQKRPSAELSDNCETLFELLDIFQENNKRKVQYICPLQMMLLVLCPIILEELVYSIEKGCPCSQEHLRKRNFVDNLKRQLHSNVKQHREAAAVITFVKLCKASTYTNNKDSNNVLFVSVQSVIGDLKSILFNPQRPFSRGPDKINQDLELMIEFFLACIRLNPNNNEVLKVCLNLQTETDGPNNRELLLWIDRLIIVDPYLMLHNPNKLDHETQMSTFELINGLVSLVYDSSMPYVAHTTMESLLVLHEKENIELWNPEACINTFWSISSQVLFSISQKLVLHQIYNYPSVLKWLREILMLRNTFLLHDKDNAYLGSNIPMAKHAHMKLEIVFFIYLWSVDIDAIKTAMSCFSLFCEEAEIRFGFDEMAVLQLLPNYNIYMELSHASDKVTWRRNALQKRILSLLRKIEHASHGNKQA
ncbi:unnamed protein product [Didymodactylos carnosus]|uniref:Uncharacterized protein n=1 Tax=Didymodactylos carnosus TaxID=1234261 RepID=A0A815JPW0_9BILA|nr:unnamed protein product [Didymodactylos carnosus]CAF4275203.1 unnamed protein product [Didymodactylos carnosus]